MNNNRADREGTERERGEEKGGQGTEIARFFTASGEEGLALHPDPFADVSVHVLRCIHKQPQAITRNFFVFQHLRSEIQLPTPPPSHMAAALLSLSLVARKSLYGRKFTSLLKEEG